MGQLVCTVSILCVRYFAEPLSEWANTPNCVNTAIAVAGRELLLLAFHELLDALSFLFGGKEPWKLASHLCAGTRFYRDSHGNSCISWHKSADDSAVDDLPGTDLIWPICVSHICLEVRCRSLAVHSRCRPFAVPTCFSPSFFCTQVCNRLWYYGFDCGAQL